MWVVDRQGRRRPFKRGETLADGESVVVPLSVMDEAPNVLTDGLGGRAGHRPGYVFGVPSEATAARDAAYEAEGLRLRDAWRGPGGKIESQDATRTGDARQAAWEAHGAWLRNAWRASQ